MSEFDFEIEVKTQLLILGRTMSSLAEEIGISVSYLSDIIKGNRKANHYKEKIKRVLKLKTEDEKIEDMRETIRKPSIDTNSVDMNELEEYLKKSLSKIINTPQRSWGMGVEDKFNKVQFENTYNSKVRLENLKKLSGELVDYIEKNFPDLLEEDVDFLVKSLGSELHFRFKSL